MKPWQLIIGVAALIAGSPAFGQSAVNGADDAKSTDDTHLSITTGVDYSSGKYGTPVTTDILVVPVNLRLTTGDWRFTATLPYLHINGASSIVGGDGGPVVIDPNAPRATRDGLGDLTLGATYAIPEERLGFGLELSGRVKVPTASQSRGLGTGKVDVAVGAEISKTFGTVTPFVSGGYRFLGDPPAINLHNAPYASAGASFAFGKIVAIGSYDYRGRVSDFSKDSHELFGALSGPLSKKLSWTIYGSAGLSAGAPAGGGGLILTYRLF